MYIGLYVKWPLFLSDFKETLILWTDFRKKCSNTKFHEHLSRGNEVRSVRTDRQK